MTAADRTCRHGRSRRRHIHYRIAGHRYCRLECECGAVIDEGRSEFDREHRVAARLSEQDRA